MTCRRQQVDGKEEHQQHQQQTSDTAFISQATDIMQNVELQTALVHHPRIFQDVQAVAALLRLSKEMQAAVNAACKGQLQVALRTVHVQQATWLVQWLYKHTGLLQELRLQLIRSCRRSGARDWAPTAATLAAALQQAGMLHLQAMALSGSPASTSILRPLQSAQLTSLAVEVQRRDAAAIRAVAALTSLRQLDLHFVDVPRRAAITAAEHLDNLIGSALKEDLTLRPLAAGLQQLTQLRMGPVHPAQLQQLPPNLQDLHLAVKLSPITAGKLQLAR
jgi:hypothetical protein